MQQQWGSWGASEVQLFLHWGLLGSGTCLILGRVSSPLLASPGGSERGAKQGPLVLAAGRKQRVGPVPCLYPENPVGTASAWRMRVLTGQRGHPCLTTKVSPWAWEVPSTGELSLPRHFLHLPSPHFLFVLIQFVQRNDEDPCFSPCSRAQVSPTHSTCSDRRHAARLRARVSSGEAPTHRRASRQSQPPAQISSAVPSSACTIRPQLSTCDIWGPRIFCWRARGAVGMLSMYHAWQRPCPPPTQCQERPPHLQANILEGARPPSGNLKSPDLCF